MIKEFDNFGFQVINTYLISAVSQAIFLLAHEPDKLLKYKTELEDLVANIQGVESIFSAILKQLTQLRT